MTMKTSNALLILIILSACVGSPSKEKGATWLESHISSSPGHYPNTYCRLTNLILNTKTHVFKYRKTGKNSLQKTCHYVDNIWPFENAGSTESSIPSCDVEYSIGYVFTMYYYFGSNYFHLHYDMMLPLYSAVYRMSRTQLKHIVFMPSVETKRLQATLSDKQQGIFYMHFPTDKTAHTTTFDDPVVDHWLEWKMAQTADGSTKDKGTLPTEMINWNTEAFKDPAYWMDMLKVLAGSHTLLPLDADSVSHGQNICLKAAYFGSPSIDIEDDDLINSYVKFIKTQLNIPHNRVSSPLIGIITRSKRRKILNEQELVDAVSKFSPVEMVKFTGNGFRDQIESVQKYSVLVGVNGAGLTNAMFLPPGSVAVQLVPFNASVNYKTFAQILRCRGPYLEWHNKHSELTHEAAHDTYRSSPDTTVHLQEFLTLMKQALSLVNSDVHYKRTEL